MRIQHKSKVIEPNMNESGDDSCDEELNLAIEQESENAHYIQLMSMLDEATKYDLPDAEASNNPTQDPDEQMRELVLACVRTKNPPIPNVKSFVSTVS